MMVDTGKILIVIPARGGSKRLPRKNVLPLAGKPLICWTIDAALESGIEARIMVTSDDEEVLSIAECYKSKGIISRKRPAILATDTATTADVLIDAVAAEIDINHPPDTIILLQPTSPLRTSFDIIEAINVFNERGNQDTVVSVCEVEHPVAWVGEVRENGVFEGVDLSGKRSQDYPKEYRLNGAVYVANSEVLKSKRSLFTDQLRASVMPRIRSIDIDEEIDFRICESIVMYECSQ